LTVSAAAALSEAVANLSLKPTGAILGPTGVGVDKAPTTINCRNVILKTG
jgi:hypothetical protein